MSDIIITQNVSVETIETSGDTVVIENTSVDIIEAVGSIPAHGQLTGLSSDDHPQYYNQSRGDARYLSNTVFDAFENTLGPLATLSPTGTPSGSTYLRGDGAWAAAGGGGGTPGGADTQIQFNDGGNFGGDTDLTWNKTTNTMHLAGQIDSVEPYKFFAAPASGMTYISTEYYTGNNSCTPLNNLTGVANGFYLWPMVFIADFEADQLAINCSTAVASALGKPVIYDSGANGWPDALIHEGSDFDFSATGVKSQSWSYTFARNHLYWIGLRHSSTAAVHGITNANLVSFGATASNSTASLSGIRRTMAYATAAPSSFSFTSGDLISNSSMPALKLRKV